MASGKGWGLKQTGFHQLRQDMAQHMADTGREEFVKLLEGPAGTNRIR